MLELRVGNKQLIREINQSIVLNTIRTHGALSRTDIAGLTNLSLSTVSGITAEFIEAGLLIEQPAAASTGGRRPIPLVFNASFGCAVGIKLLEQKLVAVLTDLEATVLAQHTEPLEQLQPDHVADQIAATVQALRPAALGRPIVGVGVGLGGLVDRERGYVRYATFLGWRDLSLVHLLKERLGLPVLIDNDVNGLTAAEQWFGAGRGVQHFMVINLGRGVGLGMVLGGQLYRGATGGAGEFGHLTIAPDGPRCVCGKLGCLEALICDSAILQRVSGVLGSAVTMEEAISLAQQGDTALQSIFSAAGRTLGMATAHLITVLNPALIIIGGGSTHVGDLLLQPFQAALQANCFAGMADHVQIVVREWGFDTWARGAASILLSELFQPVLLRGESLRPSLSGWVS